MPTFDAYEIREIAEYDDPNGGTFCEPVNNMPDEDEGELRHAVRQAEEIKRRFWTLYGHTKGEGVQDIADRDTFEEIRDLYQRITGHTLAEGEGNYTNLPADNGYAFNETLADVSYAAGVASYYSGDSRADIHTFVTWAQEFQQLHKDTDWDASDAPDYISEVEKFTDAKLVAARLTEPNDA